MTYAKFTYAKYNIHASYLCNALATNETRVTEFHHCNTYLSMLSITNSQVHPSSSEKVGFTQR